MTNDEVKIRVATDSDLDGILELQAANQPELGGTLSANFPRHRIVEMMRDSPMIVAHRAGRIVGFLMSSTRTANEDLPIVRAMLGAYAGTPDAYIYGPICVEERDRGKGLAQAMFSELRRRMPVREGVLFVRRDNRASLRAHQKMGMREVAGFAFGGHELVVFSYFGAEQ